MTLFYGDIPSCDTVPIYSAAPAPDYIMMSGAQ